MTPATDTSIAGIRSVPAQRKGQVPRFSSPKLPSWNAVQKIYRGAYRVAQVTNGALVARFEAAAAERLRVRHCVAVSSCTSGLMLTMKALGLKGEVIMPSFTAFATGMAALWTGLKPVYADCNPDTWNIDPLDAAKRVNRKTCAILGVHLYGNPCDVEGLSSIASMSRIKLIFDAAHAFGSSHLGQPIGSFGDAEVFSLSPTNLLTAGEGGLITTNDSSLAARLTAARNYGDLGAYDPILQGMNARMPEFNAAMGIAGLDAVDAKVQRHNRIASKYTRLLTGTPGVSFQTVKRGDISTYKDYSVVIDDDRFGMSRNQLVESLMARGIETRKYFYPPLHMQRLLGSHHTHDQPGLPFTEKTSGGILSLPIYHKLPVSAVRTVSRAIKTQSRHPEH